MGKKYATSKSVTSDIRDWSAELSQDFQKIKKRMNEKLEEFSISRLNPVHFYSLKVENEGVMQNLSELAAINLEKARVLLIKPYIATQKLLHEIEKTIKKAKPNITINLKDGEFKCTVPEPTAEIREEKIKNSKQVVEEARIALRNKRKELQKNFKNWYTSDNEKFSNRDLLEQEISKYLAELDVEWTKKEREFRSI
ncbi:ribosome-recycling factor [Candidatus Mycoplasma haematominutum]|uniref:Ribosome recycling factor n=1 Tax=Candidatus Mycoplasma haematominutum 'Birmingham 1' TaxID=1116213 RepID=G8C393_9MOLU|nr:ribosome-recycling factor [Candidatus Mycoplasma haematominutum]CCE66791.1 ribosome recycling factor [Candidatus Mycoplasma haematominutum 'Birmingham 1']